MALPMSGAAQQPTGDHKAAAAFLVVQKIVCGVTKESGQFPRSDKTCSVIKKYMEDNNI